MSVQFQKICKLFIIVSTLLSCQVNVFSQEKFVLDSEMLISIQKVYGNQNFTIHPVITKEVEFYPYVSGEVNTKEYEVLLKLKNKYKSEYDKYIIEKKNDSVYRTDIQTIVSQIDKYMSSKDKSDIKDKYLIEAQSIADKQNIVIKGENNSLFAKQLNDHGITKNEEKKFILYNGKKVSSKKDIEFYRTGLQKIKIQNVSISYGAKDYLKLLEEEKTIKKTEIGQVLSDVKAKKLSYFVSENSLSIDVLIGEFEKIPNQYYLVKEDVADKYLKNELTTEYNPNNVNIKTERFPIVQNIKTNKMYYVMSDQFLFQIEREIEKEKYLNMESSTEYKSWKSKYLSILTSAQTNVNACKAIIAKHTFKNIYGEKLYDSSDFSNLEKSTFNKNLDSLEKKLEQIKELEGNKDLYGFYIDKASIESSTKSYKLSVFYNETNRAY